MANKLAGIGQYNTVDPEFTSVAPSAEILRIAAMNAAPGQTAEEYLASRGGVNASGYYGDSWNAKQNLTDAEYAAARAAAREAGATGVGIGDAINRASAKKRYESALAAGMDPAKAKAAYDAELAGTAGMLKGYGYTGKTVADTKKNTDGSTTVIYGDGSSSVIPAGNAVPQIGTSSSENSAEKVARQSAYDLLYSQFKQYGLESLVEPLKGLIQKDISPSQFTIELRNTPEYKKRFAANDMRIKAGFKALDEGTYLGLEDAYQKLMMNYGLPNSYWEKGEMGVQPGFEKLIAGNVDPIELENRLQLAVDQIEKGPKEYMDAIKQFYPDVSRGDLMAYVLDPANALKAIQSKVKAAQVGGEYLRAGLGTSVGRAEELSRQGVTADMARSNIPTIIEAASRGGQLADIYASAGLGPYDQATAEEELYNMGKAAEAKKKRQQLTALEQSSFSGSYGGTQGALARDRAGAY